MNRIFKIVIALFLLSIVAIIALMVWEVLPFIHYFKYILVLFSGVLTLFSLNVFLNRNNYSKKIIVFIGFLTALPILIPLSGLLYSDIFIYHWNWWVGGALLQIAIGIHALYGGFQGGGGSVYFKLFAWLNFSLLFSLAIIEIFKITPLMLPQLFLVFGGVITTLSMLLLLSKRQIVTS